MLKSEVALRKFIEAKLKEAQKARLTSSKIGEYRGEIYWQGKESAFNDVLRYLYGERCQEGYVFDNKLKVCVPLTPENDPLLKRRNESHKKKRST